MPRTLSCAVARNVPRDVQRTLPRALILLALLASTAAQARPTLVDQAVIAPANAAPVAPSLQTQGPEEQGPDERTIVSTSAGKTAGDPYEGLNRSLFDVQQKFDRAIFRPVARGYATIIPKFIRTGLRHLLRHIREPIVFLNDVLQLKPKRAARTLARFAINSTAGIGGLLDVAKTAKLPYHHNGLGNTLARYGVGPGPYLFIPLIGPTQLRDLFGGGVDGLIYPVAIGSPFNRTDYQVSTAAIGGLDLRAESDAGFKALLDGAADPYATLRSVYQQDRAAEIAEMNGTPIAPGGLDDPLVDPEADPANSQSQQPPETTDGNLAPAPDPAPDKTTAPTTSLSDSSGGADQDSAATGELVVTTFF